MSKYDLVYAAAIHEILETGYTSKDRTGVGTVSTFGLLLDYDKISKEDFPLLTIKEVPFKSVLSELLWFLESSSDERRLAEIRYEKPRNLIKNKKTIWTDNLQAEYWQGEKFPGDLGNVYGKMWRAWPKLGEELVPSLEGLGGHHWEKELVNRPIDQIKELINNIKINPFSRRHLISAWNPGEQTPDLVALPPCHYAFQFNVRPDKTLDLLVQIRSNDIILGNPYNTASYALLLLMIAQVTDLIPGTLKLCIGNAHIYLNHIDAAKEIINRQKSVLESPTLIIDPDIKHIDAFKMDSFELTNYFPLPKISLPMAV